MAPALEDGLPAHLRRSIEATLNGKRDVFKPPPRKQAPSVSIPLSPADLDFEGALLPTSGGSSFYGEASCSRGPGDTGGSTWHNSLPYDAATAASVRSGRAPPLEQLLDSPPSGPGMLGAARLVGSAWARQQEREWFKGQLAQRPGRVNAEAERLFLAAIGPIGMSMDMWRRLPDKVEGVALRNVKRQEALELHRLRLQEWSPQVLSQSAAVAVRTALASVREGSSVAGGGGGFGGSALGSSLGDSGGGRRCMSAVPQRRYMETDQERTRIRKALDRLAAKHAHTGSPDSSSSPPPPPVVPDPNGPGPGPPAPGRAGQPTRGPLVDGGGGVDSTDPGAAASPLQLLQSLRARREARWVSETAALASRVSHFMEAESPASPRVAAAAAAAASHRAATHARVRSAGHGPPSRTSDTTSGRGLGAGCGGGGMVYSVGAVAEGGGGFGRAPSGGRHGTGGQSPPARVSFSGRATLSPVGSPRRQQLQLHQQEEEELARLPPDKAALAVRLVDGYTDACRRHRQHPEPAMCSALRRSCAPVQGEPRAHSLELVALPLTSSEAAEALAEVLSLCTHVTAVTLDRCAVSIEALGVVLPALWTLPLRRLHTVNVDFPPAVWPLLQRALGRPTVWGTEATWWLSLRTLSLAGNGLADQGLCALIEALVAMPHLQSLALRQCGLSDLSAPRLERLLLEVPGLRELDLGYNNLGSRALGALARGLHKAPQLRRLSLPWNSLGGGVAALCWTVMRLGHSHCRLERLELAGTDLVAEDLFALAAILRAFPKTSVRHIDLSHNNLVGVAGQCLLRHMNALMQPIQTTATTVEQQQQQLVAATPPAAAAAVEGGDGGEPELAVAASPRGGGAAAAAGTSVRSLVGTADGAGGSGGGATATGVKPLVPILKMPGAGARATAPDSPIKRLTINPNPQSVAGGSGGGGPAAAAPPAPSALALPFGEDPFLGGGGGGGRPSLASTFTPNLAAAVAAAAADRKASAAAAAAAAAVAAAAVRSSSAANSPSDSVTVITTGCVVEPSLPPGAKMLVRHDGRLLAAGGGGDDDAGRYGGADERDRQRQRERERERARARERERERRLASVGSFGGGGGEAAAASAAAATAAVATAAAGGGAAAARLGAGGSRLSPQLGTSDGGGGEGEGSGGGGREVTEPAGPHALHVARLDLAVELPDRLTAALLVEQEMEARRWRYRSAWRAVKWRGQVCKREGLDVAAPLDPLFEGWTHSLPREGLLELAVAALPPQLCPWLANPRLQCNNSSGT